LGLNYKAKEGILGKREAQIAILERNE